MKLLRVLAVGIFVFVSAAGWCQEGQSPVSEEDKAATQMLSEGSRLLQSKKAIEAIQQFDKVIAIYEERFKDEKARLFCARSLVESLMYLAEAMNAKTNAKVVSANWAYGYYLKAYALIELWRISEAKSNSERALSLSPRNSQFLSELGNLYLQERDWPQALRTFQLAEAAAKEFSPPDSKNIELSRALRGLGYVYVEQGKLDEAEKVYHQCLELDSKDSKALNELRYIQGLKAKNSERIPSEQQKYFAPPADYVPLDQIRIKPRFDTVLLTKENLAAEHEKCIPFIRANSESMDAAVKAFPRSNTTSAVSHASSSKKFIYRGSTGLCIEFSTNRYPIFAAETFIGTANPTGVPPDVTDDWYMKIAMKIAVNGRAKVVYAMDNGNAILASYWSDKPGDFALQYWSEFKKVGEWENTEVDYKFSHPALRGFSETKRGDAKKMVKNFPSATAQ